MVLRRRNAFCTHVPDDTGTHVIVCPRSRVLTKTMENNSSHGQVKRPCLLPPAPCPPSTLTCHTMAEATLYSLWVCEHDPEDAGSWTEITELHVPSMHLAVNAHGCDEGEFNAIHLAGEEEATRYGTCVSADVIAPPHAPTALYTTVLTREELTALSAFCKGRVVGKSDVVRSLLDHVGTQLLLEMEA